MDGPLIHWEMGQANNKQHRTTPILFQGSTDRLITYSVQRHPGAFFLVTGWLCTSGKADIARASLGAERHVEQGAGVPIIFLHDLEIPRDCERVGVPHI